MMSTQATENTNINEKWQKKQEHCECQYAELHGYTSNEANPEL